MAEIINLREFRKARSRKSKSAEAARNRALSGRTKGETARDRDAEQRAETEIDDKRLDREAPDSNDSDADEAE